ncbi:PREDICTED: uncharacterized protein LOC105366819 [Ceratosolen solmsi marchali]|uniref:Uncharacterized protein LOC105366819 n=1 Tax=Ceratosolen solmsi marchali TaxID=326594 RepID=A0AAJ6YT06_9HYME|nr:PREDICTED: uncharacterized protein LOC105366819 [Ceratosolen solmsi marchali]
MLDGWYCRSIINHNVIIDDDNSHEKVMSNYKSRYRNLKQKFKYLIYENECFQEALRSTQRQLLKANRDKSFLLDRLLHYEKLNTSFSESDGDTDTSEDDISRTETLKRKKSDFSIAGEAYVYTSATSKSYNSNKKKKTISKSTKINTISSDANNSLSCTLISDGHMTPEEVERHLESRQSYLELVPEKAPPTVPTEMFSNDVSLDKLE